MKTRLLSLTVSAAAMTLAAGPAFAQTLDYVSLSELFGEPVTAGATGVPQRASDVPATMIIITQDDIRRFPERDIPGILRHFAGVDSDRSFYGQGDVSIRGYNQPYAPRLLVLVNGRQVYLDHYGYTNWSAIPVQLEEIQQIEVIKGPQSALYGFNAVSGVVNIITRDPTMGAYQSAEISVGDGGYAEGTAVIGHNFDNGFAVRASLGAAMAEQFEGGPFGNVPGATTSEVLLPDIDFDRLTGAVEVFGQIGSSTRFSLEGTYSHVIQPEMAPLYFGVGADNILSSVKGEITSDTPFGIVTGRAYRNDLTIAYSTDATGQNNVPIDNSVTVFQLQDIFKVGAANTFRLGFEWRENALASTPTPGNGETAYTVTALSGMWNRQINRDWSLTLAGRYDQLELERSTDTAPFFRYTRADYDRSIEEFSYNAALAWKVDDRSTLRLSAGRGVQAPTLIEFGFTLSSSISTPFGVLPGAFVGNPSIEPTIIDSYELAYDRQLTDSVQLRAAVFQVETSDIKVFFGATPDIVDPTVFPPYFAFRWDNRGDSSMTGLETALNGEAGNWRWGVGYTYLSVEDDLTVNSVAFTHPLSPETSTPEHRFNGHVGWSNDDWSADVYLNHVSSTTMPREYAFGLPSRVDVGAHSGLSFRVNRSVSDMIDLSLVGQNVNFGDGQQVTSGPEVEARYWVSLRVRR